MVFGIFEACFTQLLYNKCINNATKKLPLKTKVIAETTMMKKTVTGQTAHTSFKSIVWDIQTSKNAIKNMDK